MTLRVTDVLVDPRTEKDRLVAAVDTVIGEVLPGRETGTAMFEGNGHVYLIVRSRSDAYRPRDLMLAVIKTIAKFEQVNSDGGNHHQ